MQQLEKIGYAMHRAHGTAHLCYFCAVFIEGHGVYSVLAGLLAVMSCIAWLVGRYNAKH